MVEAIHSMCRKNVDVDLNWNIFAEKSENAHVRLQIKCGKQQHTEIIVHRKLTFPTHTHTHLLTLYVKCMNVCECCKPIQNDISYKPWVHIKFMAEIEKARLKAICVLLCVCVCVRFLCFLVLLARFQNWWAPFSVPIPNDFSIQRTHTHTHTYPIPILPLLFSVFVFHAHTVWTNEWMCTNIFYGISWTFFLCTIKMCIVY